MYTSTFPNHWHATPLFLMDEGFYAVKFHANGFIKFYHFLVIILVFSDLSKKINKQINKLGDCPGNEIKVLLELLWAVDYNHSSKEGSRFYSSDN